jgi:hypothetical protein
MKAKSFLLIFVGMAAIPLILAYLALKLEWYTPGATNKGEFVQQDVSLDFGHDRPTWAIVYQPQLGGCDALCEEQIHGLNQTYVALGKLQKRVNAYVLTENLVLDEHYRLSKSGSTHPMLSPEFLYLVDPFGKVILQYKGGDNREATVQVSKDILADVKKLLNYARIG